jgi:hypothetical protein
MVIEDFESNQFIKVINVSLIKQGDMLWQDGDVVQIKDVDPFENRIEVWNKDKYLSEFIYDNELAGITTINE